ncbi:MAG: VWA domain-containing protein [Saprospiraceae bacterium]|nr:VWA domain-containing protein [Saprospiraceae bacterium]
MEGNSLSRWKLVLGTEDEAPNNIELTQEYKDLEHLLQMVYGAKEGGGFGKSSLKIKKWLDGIRLNFPTEVVQIMQNDALERQGVKEMLLEPELLEKLEPSISMVATILQLQHLLPDRTKAAARQIVQHLVSEIEQKLKYKLIFAVQKAKVQLSKPIHPTTSVIDWNKTIHRNLKHYQNNLNSIIPVQWYGYKKATRIPEIFILVDISESMIESMVYTAIVASVLASIKTVETQLIFFNTEILDFTNKYDDPVQLLFSAACGGGTDIALAVRYAAQKMRNPSDCLLFMVSDLYEGGNKQDLILQLNGLLDRGVKIYSLLSLTDSGTPEYDQMLAKQIADLDIPCFACSPDQFPELLTEALSKNMN